MNAATVVSNAGLAAERPRAAINWVCLLAGAHRRRPSLGLGLRLRVNPSLRLDLDLGDGFGHLRARGADAARRTGSAWQGSNRGGVPDHLLTIGASDRAFRRSLQLSYPPPRARGK